MSDPEIVPNGNNGISPITSNTDIQKSTDVNMEQFTLVDELQEPTDNGLELCIVRFLNNIIKLINLGALTVVLPIKAFFTLVQSIIAYRQIMNAISLKRVSKELAKIAKKFKIPSFSNPFKNPPGGNFSGSRKEKKNNILPVAADISKKIYNSAATELERNLNAFKENFKLNLALPDCLKGTLDLDKKIELPKFGTGDEKTMQIKAFQRINKLETKMKQLLEQKNLLQRQINTINKLFPTIERVQELINLKVRVR